MGAQTCINLVHCALNQLLPFVYLVFLRSLFCRYYTAGSSRALDYFCAAAEWGPLTGFSNSARSFSSARFSIRET